ncbi:MAG: hypothetical protein IPP83_17835 [Flavobacteriales bacterium]|nr:hypothetical protein [Flavobacteriales bacterium]
MVVTITISVRGLWVGNEKDMARAIVRSDVKGYYGYLQALFIRNDLGNEPYQWEYVRRTPTGTLNKYFCGTAMMMAPWFAIGHDIALGDPKAAHDGLSIHEMRAISIGAWFYLFISLLALRKLLLGLGVREGVLVWLLIALGFGTQVMQYTALQPGWSHVYSFCAISLFLLVVQRLVRGGRVWWLILANALLALIILIRPVNGLVLLAIPVIAGADLVPFMKRILDHRLVLGIAILVGFAVLFIQPLLWYAQIGKWFAYGYAGEGFHWDRPEVLKVLFGFRRGLFLWTPVLLLSAVGTLWLFRKDRVRAWSMALYWGINVYVISAWWIWYYGSGFGSRVFVDHYPVLVVPMAILLNDLGNRWWTATRIFIVLCCALLLFQMWQYHVFILHHESMDREKYAYTFLRWDDRYRGALAGNYQSPPFNPKGMDVVMEESCDFEHACMYWSGAGIERISGAYSGSHAAVFTKGMDYGLGFSVPAGVLPSGHALYMEVGLQRLERSPGASQPLLAVTDVKHADGSQAYYEPFHINPIPATLGKWEQVEYRIPVPALQDGDRLSFYFWNQSGDAQVLIDDVFMRISAVRPY